VNDKRTETFSKAGAAKPNASADDEIPRLIVVCECKRLTAPAFRVALSDLHEVTVGRGLQRSLVRQNQTATLSIPDNGISSRHFVLRRRADGWAVADLGSKNGILVNDKSARTAILNDGDLIEAGGTLLMFREEGGRPDDKDRDLAAEPATPIAFRTVSPELEHRIRQLTKIARTEAAVLIRGDTGTGKELIARAVHDVSARRGPFIAINCGALPRNLIESELFGYKRGAFSGAYADHEGLVSRANGGTLFLDEITELPEESQAALLRFLEDSEVRPIGANRTVKVDIRVIAATNRDISARIADGGFREDLYARLAGFEMVLPALRDRREDLGTAIAAILPHAAQTPEHITLHRSAARALFRYNWPLNIRELKQALHAAVTLTDTGELQLDHFPEAIRTYVPSRLASMLPEDLARRDRVIELLREHHGNIAAVARAIEAAPTQVRRWCDRFQIDLSLFRG
jgi:DNA-binding NtrC family response regulator